MRCFPSGLLAGLLAILSLASGWTAPRAIADAAERPNFVFIYTDDQRWDTLGVVQREQGERGRFPWLESPHLDRLAAEGIRFRQAFVVTALCSPSRAAFLTGRPGHLNGVVNNHTPFPQHSVTHASLLRAAGYRTGYVGKWHMGSQSGPRAGCDFSASFVGQGVYFDGPWEVNGVRTPTTGWVDDVATDYALQFITENRARPFSLVLGYKTCHGPFTPPPRTSSLYADAQARSVPNLDTPAIYRRPAAAVPGEGPAKSSPAVRPTDTAAATAPSPTVKTNLGMFRGLRAIDENVGRILDTLDRLQLTDNTVVVYTSDNGFYLGEHGLGDKRSAYEESMRIPLLLRYPRRVRPGQVSDHLVLNIDLAPTWLDLAGLPIPAEMQGRSWRPLWEGRTVDPPWRTAFLYSYFREGRFAIPTVVALRTTAAKLIHYPGRDDWSELFDLQADPYETTNRYADPQFADLRASLQAEFEREVARTQYHVPEFADERQSGGREPAGPEPGGPTSQKSRPPVVGWVLDLSAAGWAAAQVRDRSEQQNHATNHGVTRQIGREQQLVLQFDGRSHLDLGKPRTLDPTDSPWTIEATIRATEDGVILARGGQTLGYLLAIQQGQPLFVYRAGEQLTTLRGKDDVRNQWVTVTATVSADRRASLAVDGQIVAHGTVPRLIPRDPNDGLQVGADLASPVVEPRVPAFHGQMERLRLWRGVLGSD